MIKRRAGVVGWALSMWRKRLLLATAFLLLLVGYSAYASESGGPVYKLEWINAWYDGSTVTLPKTMTSTSLEVKPDRNMTTSQRLKITFSFSGKDTAIVPANTVEIRIPASIFTNAQGKPAESSVVVPLPMNTSFNYRLDTTTKEYVIYNFTEINEALIFTVEVDYKVLPSNVKLPSGPGETILPYEKDITAQVTIARPNETPVVSYTETLQLKYSTDSKLSSVSKSASTVYSTWPSSWGTAPDDAADYFYVQWTSYIYATGSSTQPYTLKVTDTPDATTGGQVVGWYLSSTGTKFANRDDGWANNLEEFHAAAATAQRVNTPSTGGTGATVYLYMRYPRPTVVDPVTGNKSVKISNTITADLIGDYGAADSRSSAATYVYTEKPWVIPSGAYSASKGRFGDAPGMIDRLENAWLAGKTDPLFLHPSASYTWSVSSARSDWARTQDAAGNYGMQEWTAIHQDSQFSFDTSNAASTTSYYQLLPGDYALTNLTLSQPKEMIYGTPDAMGNNSPIAQDLAKYGEVKVQVATVVKPTESDWITIGVSRVNAPASAGWTYTPTGGTPTTMASGAIHNIDLTTVAAGQSVLGVRMLQTTKAGIATQDYRLKMVLYPTDHVIAGLKPFPGRDGAIRNSVYLYNQAINQSTGGNIASSADSSMSASIQMTRQSYYAYHSKSTGTAVTDYAARLIRIPFTLHAYNSSYFPSSTTRADAIAMDLLQEQTEGVFYDLLPIGTSVDLSSIRVHGYQGGGFVSSYKADYSVEVIDNYRGTGRSLLIIRASMPETVSNFYASYTSNTNLYSGFSASFNVINTFDNLLDNPKSGRNYSAYESTVGKLGSGGHSDLPPTSGFAEPAAITAFTDVNGQAEPDAVRFLHAYSDWAVNPPLSTQLGFDKLVKSPEDSAYSKETVVQGGGAYTYRLRLANYPDTSARNIIFYDSFEDRAPTDAPEYWQGKLASIDLSHPRLTWGIEPVVYYATRRVEPKNTVEDRLVVNDQINTTVWQKLDLSQGIPGDLKAVAVDMRFRPDGTPFVLPPERSLIVSFGMRAPGDVTPYVNPTDYAWNSAYLGAQTERAGMISANAVVDVTPTKVSLRPVDLTVSKLSAPGSGTSELPAVVLEGSQLKYTIGVRNTNRAESITGVVLEDSIPAGLAIDAANITYRFGATSFQLLSSGTKRITYTRDGQRLIFRIDQLAAGEQVEFMIPTTVLRPPTAQTVRHENTAVVTQAFGYTQDIKSPTTYHETPAVAVPLSANKVFKAGGRVPQAGEFFLELTDTTSARNRIAGPYPNSGTAPYAFEIPNLILGKTGYHNFYLGEVRPADPETNLTYSLVEFYVSVKVDYNSTTRSLTATPVVRMGSTSGALQTMPVNFINTYKATGTFTPSIGKLLKNMPLPDADYDGKFRATLRDELGREYTVSNSGGQFTFGTRAFTEQDIGRVLEYRIQEIPERMDSVIYDAREITLRVKVLDAGDGALKFDASYWLGDSLLTGDDAKIINRFESTPFTAYKVWKQGDAGIPLPKLPSGVRLQLYRDGMPYGAPVDVMDPAPTDTPADGTKWSYTWDALPKLKADGSGQDSVYYAVELSHPAHFQYQRVGDTVINTYRSGAFTARKFWEGIPVPGPGIYQVKYALYQTVQDDPNNPPIRNHMGDVILDGEADAATTGSRETMPWVYTWEGLPASGAEGSYEYEVEEIGVFQLNDAGVYERSPDFDVMSAASTMVTNRYLLTSFTANKVWENGPEIKPAVTLYLLQNGSRYNGDGAPYQLQPGELSHTWNGLPRFDADGALYVYAFEEGPVSNYVSRPGVDSTTIINSYVPPLIDVVATKAWVGGPADDHLTSGVLDLFIEAQNVVTGETEHRLVAVPPTVTQVPTGGQRYEWPDLPKTTMDGVDYTYLVKERNEENGQVLINGNTYQISKATWTWTNESLLETSVVNTYVSPKGDIVAQKLWKNGPMEDRATALSLDLYRKIEGDAEEQLVPDVTPEFDQENQLYTWRDLPLTDDNGAPYLYATRERDAVDGIVTIGGNQYQVSYGANRLDITNSFIVPLRTVQATKTWEGGPPTDRQPPAMRLYRKTAETENELVIVDPVITADAVTGAATYTWEDLPATTSLAVPYIYSVAEASELDGVLLVNGHEYQVNYGETDGTLTVVNTYIQPRGPVYATKRWVGGPAGDHTEVSLELYRKTFSMTEAELVSEPYTAVVDAESVLYTYMWEDLPLRDIHGDLYEYSVKELGETAGVYTVNGHDYAVSHLGLLVVNEYQPKMIVVTATKTWEGGPKKDHQPVKLLLYRQTEQETEPILVDAEATVTGKGPYTYTWQNLEDSAPDGLPYTYTVREDGEAEGKVTINGNTYEVVQGTDAPRALINRFVPSAPPPQDYPEIRVPLSAKKILQGGALTEDQYRFQLKDAAGTVLAEVGNRADGSIIFPDRTFSRVVTDYLYTIVEVQGEDKDTAYDSTRYTVLVTTRASGGELLADVDILRDGTPYAGDMVFTNIRHLPKTGDSTFRTIVILLAISAALACGAWIIQRVKKRGDK